MHFNTVSGKLNLAKDDIDYHFSSARFYETGVDDFGILNNSFKIFDKAKVSWRHELRRKVSAKKRNKASYLFS